MKIINNSIGRKIIILKIQPKKPTNISEQFPTQKHKNHKNIGVCDFKKITNPTLMPSTDSELDEVPDNKFKIVIEYVHRNKKDKN